MAIAAKQRLQRPGAIFRGAKRKQHPSLAVSDDSDPYQNEWDALVLAIRDDKPYSEVKRGVYASLTSSLGRMAAHTGRSPYRKCSTAITNLARGWTNFVTKDSPSPLPSDAQGRYPIPQPGLIGDREY